MRGQPVAVAKGIEAADCRCETPLRQQTAGMRGRMIGVCQYIEVRPWKSGKTLGAPSITVTSHIITPRHLISLIWEFCWATSCWEFRRAEATMSRRSAEKAQGEVSRILADVHKAQSKRPGYAQGAPPPLHDLACSCLFAALAEISKGRKTGHWIWSVRPLH